jgi:hypothetical protein
LGERGIKRRVVNLGCIENLVRNGIVHGFTLSNDS